MVKVRVRVKGYRAAPGHLQDFLAHIHDPEPVPELGEAIQLGVAFLQGHLLFAGQLTAEVLHQLALQRQRRTKTCSEHCHKEQRQEPQEPTMLPSIQTPAISVFEIWVQLQGDSAVGCTQSKCVPSRVMCWILGAQCNAPESC